MARYTGPKCRRCRQVGIKLFLKGIRCTTKCPLDNAKPFPPGQHGKSNIGKKSEYGRQQREKQKMRYMFGMNEKQFRLMFEKASKKTGVTGDTLLQLLERRLDNVIYRAGFASSRDQAKQYVNHGLFKVNGRNVDMPSFLVKPNDKFEFKASAKKSKIFENLKNLKIRPPRWIKVDVVKGGGEIIDLPRKEDFEKAVAVQSIVEFYSK
ncbi:MAG: 30S ribosomal protein S4, small subunit ribosomal protein S4 [Candidatus Peregrinibacteria bacterium GW2011_GWF2_33_10]|nr:MAG: 30S ribosomal protein S4, small subunit ribosomal protein S4 [Candidatus Peregrinibacteria bacterium GW2011_GWF2_33_10]OGJ46113.1 MAG: 30S ribosomal protein S4 [Candidatus Peregrinibacteria bacterium RIFOXYA12_FULL_33_12]OGJ46182.1 MAG: 30S ribosomal protein S4 [Candidatus Peregrinibacteria bacterium RIFOXYA2_FULL_33_21]OGJ51598.1 MAG: 30S ribosomal protein S4 [Candidatus Peregrinibacteria bacterium RIFOXYB2_FULL_33_20]